MSTSIIVSYDGTHNEDDAVALGRVFAQAGAEVSLAYVRHASEAQAGEEALAEHEAEELVGSSRVDLQACKLEYSIVSPK